MLNWILNNKESILAFIAIAAFILSIIQLIVGLCKKKTKLNVKLENIQQNENNGSKDVILLLTMLNRSDAPISITRVILIDKRCCEYKCSLKHKWIGEHYYPKFFETDIPRTERIFTVDFPITLIANGARMEYVHFNVGNLLDTIKTGDKVTLRFLTDKKACTFHVVCPDSNDILHI